MSGNMTEEARHRTASDTILENAIDPIATETSGESQGTELRSSGRSGKEVTSD